MHSGRKVAERDHLAAIARAALGDRFRLADVARLQGGTKKGVYRLTFDDASTAIVYSWDAAENYWPTNHADESDNQADPFSHASGFDLFQAAHARMNALGVRTPRVYLADQSRETFPSDVAVVEDIRGGTLEATLQQDPQVAKTIVAQLGSALERMHLHEGPNFGKVSLIDNGGLSRGNTCEQLVLDAALNDLTEAGARDKRIADAHVKLDDTIREWAAAVRPRSRHGLIHGELGPDHVLVDQLGHPVIIDIEGLMYFDVEWEHVFLRLRFGEHYAMLRGRGLDEQRLRFYRLAMHLSLVAKPLSILDGDFPDREGMMGIAEFNLKQALSLLP